MLGTNPRAQDEPEGLLSVCGSNTGEGLQETEMAVN